MEIPNQIFAAWKFVWDAGWDISLYRLCGCSNFLTQRSHWILWWCWWGPFNFHRCSLRQLYYTFNYRYILTRFRTAFYGKDWGLVSKLIARSMWFTNHNSMSFIIKYVIFSHWSGFGDIVPNMTGLFYVYLIFGLVINFLNINLIKTFVENVSLLLC